jgi:hypothetical protein
MPNPQIEIQNIVFEVVEGNKIGTVRVPRLKQNNLLQAGIVVVNNKPVKRLSAFELIEQTPTYSLILGGHIEPAENGDAYTIEMRSINSPPRPTAREDRLLELLNKIDDEVMQWDRDRTAKPRAQFDDRLSTTYTSEGRLSRIQALLKKHFDKHPEDVGDDDLFDLD